MLQLRTEIDCVASLSNSFNTFLKNAESVSTSSTTQIPRNENWLTTFCPSSKFFAAVETGEGDTKNHLRMLKIRLNPTTWQKIVLERFRHTRRAVWNATVALKALEPLLTKIEVKARLTTNTIPLSKNLSGDARRDVVKKLTPFMRGHKWMLRIPNSIRQRAVDQYFSAKKSANSNLLAGHQKHHEFDFKSKKKERSWTIGLDKRQVSFENGKLTILSETLCSDTTDLKPPKAYRDKIHDKRTRSGHRGKRRFDHDETRMRVFEKPFFQGNPKYEPKIHYDGNGRYFLMVPTKMTTPVVTEEKLHLPIVGVDPGISTFATTFSTDGVSFTVKEPVDELLRRKREIDRWTSVLNSKKFAMSAGWRKTAKRRIRTERQRFRDFQDDFHRQLANFLATKHSVVFLERPDLVQWRKNASPSSKYRMNAANASKFFNRLEHCCRRRGCVTPKTKESFTTVGCSRCGGVREMPTDVRTYRCGNCGLVMGRDVNSAKNIILTNVEVCEIPPCEDIVMIDGFPSVVKVEVSSASTRGRDRKRSVATGIVVDVKPSKEKIDGI
jgi:transposase